MRPSQGRLKSVSFWAPKRNRGYVLGVDFSGPYPESNDGETHALQGVEVGTTDFGLLHCCKDKSGASADSGVADFIRTLETQGTEKVIRVHSDQDAAFKARNNAYLVPSSSIFSVPLNPLMFSISVFIKIVLLKSRLCQGDIRRKF